MRVRVHTPPAALDLYVRAGVLAPADVHVAEALCRTSAADDPQLVLAAALAVRAPRLQHVCVDLDRVDRIVPSDDADPDVDPGSLWTIDTTAWLAALATSPLVTVVDDARTWRPPPPGTEVAPLVLCGGRLYLDRLWRDELAVASALRDRAARAVQGVALPSLRRHLDAAFDAPAPDQQRVAAAAAALGHLAVVAGGPGTGKTTTVARLLAVLDDLAVDAGTPLPTVALAAPTGKAAQRLTASVRAAASALGRPGDDPTVLRLRALEATTLHRLLGPRADSRTRFRHHAGAPLPHDLVVVDETSMVSLALIARLLDAVRPEARLVLLGDPEQLASVEAGSVLGDLVGTAATAPVASPAATARLAAAAGDEHVEPREPAPDGVHDSIVVLHRVHRFRSDSGIADLATAIQRGDADAVVDRLAAGGDVQWVADDDLAAVRELVLDAAVQLVDAGRDGDADRALAHLDDVRVLCANRRGPSGVTGWVALIEGWLAEVRPGIEPGGARYPGRPVLVTANDRRARLVNGDVGVVVRSDGGGVHLALPDVDGSARPLSLARLPAAETVHAMTIHKSQGSQFGAVVVVLPEPGSPLLSRELLYTAVTRARNHATIVGSEAALRAAVERRAVRASGLADAL
jgi:exodeoxyribonuclease V alpha subunit